MLDLLFTLSLLLAVGIFLFTLYRKDIAQFEKLPLLLFIYIFYRLMANIFIFVSVLIGKDDIFTNSHILSFSTSFFSIDNIVVNILMIFCLFVIAYLSIKGSARIVEEMAQFNLGAMVEKQMAIERNLKSKIIDKEEANKKNESIHFIVEFTSSIDGLSKFIKIEFILTLLFYVILLFSSIDSFNGTIFVSIVLLYFLPIILVSASTVLLVHYTSILSF